MFLLQYLDVENTSKRFSRKMYFFRHHKSSSISRLLEDPTYFFLFGLVLVAVAVRRVHKTSISKTATVDIQTQEYRFLTSSMEFWATALGAGALGKMTVPK